MRFSFSVFAILAFMAAQATEAPADSMGGCQNESGYPLSSQIDACTAIIGSGKAVQADLALAYKRRGRAFLDAGDTDKAITDNSEAIRLKPDFADAFGNRGIAYGLQGDFTAALADADKAVRLRGNAHDHFARANILMSAHEYRRAIDDLDQAIKLDPNYVEALANRGYVFRQLHRPDLALADLGRSLALRPDATSYTIRGDVNGDLADFPAAIRDYTSALRLNANLASAYAGRARAYAETGGELFALQDLQRAIEIQPNNPEHYNNRAIVLSHLGQTELALKDYDRVLALNPRSAFAYSNRAIILIGMKEYARAVADLDRAIEISPFAAAYANRGSAYVGLKSFNKAIADFTRALQSAPSLEVHLARATALAAKGPAFFAEAKQDVVAAMRIAPASTLPYLALGVIYYRSGNFPAALKSFESATRGQAELDAGRAMIVPEARYLRGLTLKAMGRVAEGQADIDFARKAYPDIDSQIEERGVRRDATMAARAAPRPEAPTAVADQCKVGVRLNLTERLKACDTIVAAQTTTAGRIDALMWRAQLYIGASDWDHALADYRDVIKLDPKHAQARAALAETLANRGDLSGGITAFGRALELAPTNAGFWARRCWMRARLGTDLDGALSDCQHALVLQPGADFLLGARAFVYFVRKDYAASIADYDADLRLVQPGLEADPYSLYGRGLAKLRLGNREGGQSDMAAARALEPSVGEEFASWGFKP